MNPNKYQFSLAVDPASLPTAQQKGVRVTTVNGRNIVQHYTKAEVRKAAEHLRVAILRAMHGKKVERPRDSAWFLSAIFVYAKPASYPKSAHGAYKTTRPDIDNLLKGLMDAITASGCFWKDDSQVMIHGAYKRWSIQGESPRILVAITVPSKDEDGVIAHEC